MDEENEKNYSTGGGIIGFIIFVLIVWWVYNSFIKTDYSKPWWEGVRVATVCERPYYSLTNCYTLQVERTEDSSIKINFPNGGYVYGEVDQCYKGAKDSDFNNNERVCSIVDNEGRTWDILDVVKPL
jgi:hypothetical protein